MNSLPSLEEVRKAHVLHMLEAFGRKQGRAARALGIDRKTLSRWLMRWEGGQPSTQFSAE